MLGRGEFCFFPVNFCVNLEISGSEVFWWGVLPQMLARKGETETGFWCFGISKWTMYNKWFIHDRSHEGPGCGSTQLKPIERFECDWWWSCRDLRLVGPVSAGLEIIITTCYWLRGSAVCSLNGGIQLKWIRTQKVYRSGILRPSHHQFPHITHRQYFNQIKLLTIRSYKLKAFSLLAILFDIFR